MVDGDVPERMQAAAFDEFGGPEVITLRKLPIPQVADDEVLIKVWSAGVGVWDAYEREGVLVPEGSALPIVPGSDGAGTVIAVGSKVTSLAVGDLVYVSATTRPKGGFYAEYASVKARVRGEGARWCARRARRCHAHRRADRAGRARHPQPVGRRLAADLRRERRSGSPGRAVGEAAGAERDRRGVRTRTAWRW